jgi:hypothetical protein
VAILTLAGMRAHGQLLCLDTDTNSPAIGTAEWASLINEKYLTWHEKVERRFKIQASASSGFTITSLSAGVVCKVTSTATDYAEIERVMYYQAASTALLVGAQLEKKKVSEIYRLFNEDQSLTAQPKYYALERTETGTTADIGKWTLYVQGPVDVSGGAFQFPCFVRSTPTALSADADTPDVTHEAAYTIARLAAIEAANLMRDADLATRLAQPIPDDIRSHFGLSARVSDRPVRT